MNKVLLRSKQQKNPNPVYYKEDQTPCLFIGREMATRALAKRCLLCLFSQIPDLLDCALLF